MFRVVENWVNRTLIQTANNEPLQSNKFAQIREEISPKEEEITS